MKCGLCQSTSSSSQFLLCSSCINHQFLPLRIQLLQALQKHETAKSLIDIILKDHCVHGANYDFIRQVIQNKVQWEELKQGELSVGKESVIALASQLLSVDSRLISKDIGKLRKLVEMTRLQVEELANQEERSKETVMEFQHSMTLNDNEEKETVEFDEIISNNNRIMKQIQHSQSLLFHELMKIYIIKKKKLLNSSNSIIMISFTPVLSIPQILDLNRDVINFSFQIMCKFAIQLSSLLDLILPFQITYRDPLLKSHPEILKFQLSLPLEINKIHELSNFELKLFINGIARLSINFFKILQRLKLDSEIIQYTQLFKIDEMVYKLAHTDYTIPMISSLSSGNGNGSGHGGNGGGKLKNDEIPVINGEKKIDVDVLVVKLYKFLTGKINQKSNEWHVVKERSFN